MLKYIIITVFIILIQSNLNFIYSQEFEDIIKDNNQINEINTIYLFTSFKSCQSCTNLSLFTINQQINNNDFKFFLILELDDIIEINEIKKKYPNLNILSDVNQFSRKNYKLKYNTLFTLDSNKNVKNKIENILNSKESTIDLFNTLLPIKVKNKKNINLEEPNDNILQSIKSITSNKNNIAIIDPQLNRINIYDKNNGLFKESLKIFDTISLIQKENYKSHLNFLLDKGFLNTKLKTLTYKNNSDTLTIFGLITNNVIETFVLDSITKDTLSNNLLLNKIDILFNYINKSFLFNTENTNFKNSIIENLSNNNLITINEVLNDSTTYLNLDNLDLSTNITSTKRIDSLITFENNIDKKLLYLGKLFYSKEYLIYINIYINKIVLINEKDCKIIKLDDYFNFTKLPIITKFEDYINYSKELDLNDSLVSYKIINLQYNDDVITFYYLLNDNFNILEVNRIELNLNNNKSTITKLYDLNNTDDKLLEFNVINEEFTNLNYFVYKWKKKRWVIESD